MLGATVFGAVLAWWERGPIEPASARRSEARHLMPWVGLRLLATLVAARGLITILTWPGGRLLGLLCVIFSLPYLFPWTLARLAIARKHLGWAEGMGRLGAAHFNGSSHHAGLVARSWAAWRAKRPEELEASTERLEAHFHGPDTIICRAGMAQLAGRPREARALLASLTDFDDQGLADPARAWIDEISNHLEAEAPAEAKAAGPAPAVPDTARNALQDDAPGVQAWKERWADLVIAESVLVEVRQSLARVSAVQTAEITGRDQLDWSAELEAFRKRVQNGTELPIALEWATWCTLRRRAEVPVGPQGALTLRELWDPASHFAVRLWGEPGGRMLAAAVLRWLQGRARLMDDPSRHASASRQLMLAS